MSLSKFFSFGVFIFLISLLTSCSSTTPGKSVFLKFNLDKGKTYSYEMDVVMESEVNGKKMNSDMNFDYDIEVMEDKDSIKTLKTTYKRVVMKGSGAVFSIDTDRPARDSISDVNTSATSMTIAMFRAIIGKSFIMKVDAEGNVTEINGLKEMAEEVVTSMKIKEELKPQVRRLFSNQFNGPMLKQSFSQAFYIYPNKIVEKGDSWDKSINLAGRTNSAINSTYKVGSFDDSTMQLDVSGALEIGEDKVIQNGVIILDPRTGLVTYSENTQSFKGKLLGKTKITGKVK